MDELSTHLPRLESFRMTILRASSFGSVEWTRSPGSDGKWTGGLIEGRKEEEKTDAQTQIQQKKEETGA